MSMKVKDLIEEAMQDILEARADVIAGGWDVYIARKNDAKRGDNFILVSCTGGNRIMPNYDRYKHQLSVVAISKTEQDIAGKSNLEMYEVIEELIQQDLTFATLQTAITAITASSGIVIDGLVPMDESEDRDDSIHGDRVMTEIFVTYTTPT